MRGTEDYQRLGVEINKIMRLESSYKYEIVQSIELPRSYRLEHGVSYDWYTLTYDSARLS